MALFGVARTSEAQLALIGSGGGMVSSGEVLGSFSIGETIVSSESVSGFILTQGFQQNLRFLVGVPPVLPSVLTTYPNPFNEEIFMSISKEIALGHLEIFHINGHLAYQVRRFFATEELINLSLLTPGTYVVRLTDLISGIIYQNIIVKK